MATWHAHKDLDIMTHAGMKMKNRQVEITHRALKIIGVSSVHETDAIKSNFRRQIKRVFSFSSDERIKGIEKEVLGMTLIQAYHYLVDSRETPTTLVENDEIVGTLLDGDITPIEQTVSHEEWNARRFYDQFHRSIWPRPSNESVESMKYKFGKNGRSV